MKRIIAEVNIKPKTTKTGKEYDLIIATEEFSTNMHFISDWSKRIHTYPKRYVLIFTENKGFKTLIDFRDPEEKEHPIEVMVKEDKTNDNDR